MRPPHSETKEKHRIQMDVGPKTLARLERLKEQFEASSYAEVIRLALHRLEKDIDTVS